jgi:hypothetical protein
VVPVLRARKGLGDALSGGRTGEAAEFILNALPAAARRRTGPGVQLDYDCPTAALADYAALLEALRGRCARRTLSFTALPDWLNSRTSRASPGARTIMSSRCTPSTGPRTGRAASPVRTRKGTAWARRAAGLGPSLLHRPAHAPVPVLFDASGKFRALTAEQDPGRRRRVWRAREASRRPRGDRRPGPRMDGGSPAELPGGSCGSACPWTATA